MKRVMVDFDGPVHKYSRGWQDGTAYDEPTEGAREALDELRHRGFEVVVFSTRDAEQIETWLLTWGFPAYRVTNVKEPAVAYIDDRAIHWVDWGSAMTEMVERYGCRP